LYDPKKFSKRMSEWVAEKMGHDGALLGLPPVPDERPPEDPLRPWLVPDIYEEDAQSLATYLVKSVFDMAMKEAGSWLISTIRRQGFEGLRPLLEEGKDLLDAMSENLSENDEIQRSDRLGRFKFDELSEASYPFEDDDPWL
jgi:hypothetical protein